MQNFDAYLVASFTVEGGCGSCLWLVRIMAVYFNSTSETMRRHNFLPRGSLQDWRMHACCAAGNPLVRALGKLLFDTRVRERYRQCERCKRMPFYFECADRKSTTAHQIRSTLCLADVSLSRVLLASSLFQCLVPCFVDLWAFVRAGGPATFHGSSRRR